MSRCGVRAHAIRTCSGRSVSPSTRRTCTPRPAAKLKRSSTFPKGFARRRLRIMTSDSIHDGSITMKTQIERFTLLIAALAIGRAAVAQQDGPIVPGDRTYELSVVMQDGGDFRDCATFREDQSLVLEAGTGLTIDWVQGAAERTGASFHAVTRAGNPYGLALHGVFASSGAISGDAVNDRGLTFTFLGTQNSTCTIRAVSYTPSGVVPGPIPSAGPWGALPSNPVLYEPNQNSVAGRLYDVRLFGRPGGDCYSFAVDGVLATNGGINLVWRMGGLNAVESTFQAVGSPSLGTGGIAVCGRGMPWGELRVHGVERASAGLRPFVGSGVQTPNCIQ